MAAPNPEIAFLMAACDGDLTLLKRLAPEVGNGGGLTKSYETVTDFKGRNALHLAAAAGNTHVCKFLVENLKFDVESKESQGNTPLISAILADHHPTAVYLIENGAAAIGCTNRAGYTALHVAAEIGQIAIMSLLLSKGAKVEHDLNTAAGSPLQCACCHGKNESVKLLLDNGADPNSSSNLSSTPLMLSIAAKSYECLMLLLKAGADPNVCSLEKTPLIGAVRIGDIRIIKRLQKAGANPNVVSSSLLITPLEIAALYDEVDAVKVLFPFTSRITSFPDWSVDGIMKHIISDEVVAQMGKRLIDDLKLAKTRGREAFKRKDYWAAIYWFSQASSVDSNVAALLSNRSLCWVMLNQGKKALDDAKACVALKPDWPKAHYREGVAWTLLDEYSRALEAFSQALRVDPINMDIKKAHSEAVEAAIRMQKEESENLTLYAWSS